MLAVDPNVAPIQAVTRQVESKRPLAQTCKDACLIHIYPSGMGMGTRYVLEQKTIVLGRGDDCQIKVQDCSISRRHTRFDLDVDGYLASDLDSTNGTFVNDAPANRTPLADGDYLRVGNCLFRFLAGGNVEADYHDELYRLAIVDALTGLHNKRYLMDHLQRELVRSARNGRPLTLMLFDIDHFKAINDKMGHLAGDLTLRELAGRLKSEFRKDDLIARYGGEEFAAVLSETDSASAAKLAEHIRQIVEDHRLTFDHRHYAITVSIGVASTKETEALSPQDLIQRADEKLYRAKREGRNRVVS